MAETVHQVERDGLLGSLEQEFWTIAETLEGEYLKTAAELALSGLSRTDAGIQFLELVSGKNRVDDPRLRTTVAGIELENPVMVGAGWDKKGRAVAGLHALGFSAVEIGTVTLFPQPGNSRPRLWTSRGSVGLNRLAFNSDGAEAVDRYLNRHQGSGIPIGVNVGLNRLVAHSAAPDLHAKATEMLEPHASYIVLNVSSPSTEGIRALQKREALKVNIEAVKDQSNGKPVFVKISPDEMLDEQALTDVIDVAQETGIAGIICANTTVDQNLKAIYGWENQAGGLSGDDQRYREAVHQVMTRIVSEIRSRVGSEMEVIRVGGINSPEHAIKALLAGASAVQVVTGIRQNKWRAATVINRGILHWMDTNGVSSISEMTDFANR